MATLTLARQTGLEFLAAFGTGLVACLVVFWAIIALRTLRGAWRRTLFVSPCLLTGAIPCDFEAGRRAVAAPDW